MLKRFIERLKEWLPTSSKVLNEHIKLLSAQISSQEKAFLYFFEKNQSQMNNLETQFLETYKCLNEKIKLQRQEIICLQKNQSMKLECLSRQQEEILGQLNLQAHDFQLFLSKIEQVKCFCLTEVAEEKKRTEIFYNELKEMIIEQNEKWKDGLQKIIIEVMGKNRKQEEVWQQMKMEMQTEIEQQGEEIRKLIVEIKAKEEKQIGFWQQIEKKRMEQNEKDKSKFFEYVSDMQKKMDEKSEALHKRSHYILEQVEKDQEEIFGHIIRDRKIEEAQLNSISRKLEDYKKEDNQKISNLHTEVMREFRVRRNIKPKQIYVNLTEREALSQSFREIMENSDVFEKKFLALISGLNEKSITNVIRILVRMKKIIDGNTKGIDFFTQEEQEEFLKMKSEFSDQILCISDSLYCYNGLLLPVNQFDSSVFWSKYGLEEVNALEKIACGDIIDVGGYVGDTALLFSPMTEHNVYVFEASPYNYDLIKKTINLNKLNNIVVENLALGKERCQLPLSLGERSSCNTLVERSGYVYPEKMDVQVISLDEYVAANNLQVSLIKIDVEGAEQMVLDGAIETIRRFKPVLLISIYHTASDFFDIKPMIESLGLGYKFSIYKPVNNAIVIETVLIAEVK